MSNVFISMNKSTLQKNNSYVMPDDGFFYVAFWYDHNVSKQMLTNLTTSGIGEICKIHSNRHFGLGVVPVKRGQSINWWLEDESYPSIIDGHNERFIYNLESAYRLGLL